MSTPPWFETWFDSPEYDLVYQHRTREEADRFVNLLISTLALPKGSRVVDIACGRGRHALAFARNGMDVHGYDLSERALRIAKERAELENLRLSLYAHDKRVPVCTSCADLVVNLFTAFGYFATDEEHRNALRAMLHAVKPGGYFVQDFLNPEFVRAHLEPESRQDLGGLRVDIQRRVEHGRVHKTLTVFREYERYTFEESVALLTPEKITQWLQEAGFTLLHHWGTYDGQPWSPNSPRSILIAQA